MTNIRINSEIFLCEPSSDKNDVDDADDKMITHLRHMQKRNVFQFILFCLVFFF